MIFLSSAWAWIKKSWKLVIGLIIGFLAAFFALREGPVAEGFRVLKKLRKDDEELEDKIDSELQFEAEREKRIEEETARRLAEIEEKFKEKNKELEQNKKEEIERIVRETDGNPSELARRLGELTGLTVASNDVE